MVTDLLRAARDPAAAQATRARAPQRFSGPARGVPVVVWNVVGHCNLSCPHCYAAASLAPSAHDLRTDEALRLLEQLAETGTQVIIFSGGEPLLRGDLFELIERAVALGLSPQLSTNGTLLDDTTAARLREAGVRYVGVSVDGTRPFNDRYRGMVGAFQRASDGLRAARRAGMRTGLRLTLSRANAEQLEAVLAHATELGVDRFYVSHLVYSGRAARMADADLLPAESRAVLERLFELALGQLGDGVGPEVVTGGNDSDGPALLLWLEARLGREASARAEALLAARGGNSAGEKLLDIDHLGRVHPDQFWQAARLGDVRHTSFAEILRHPLLAQLRDRTRLLTGRCGECRWLELCRGSHRERALAVHHDPWAPDPACVMTDAEIGRAPSLRKAAP
ncbi:MAG: radical SAM protein [Polyangiaceae bacterium]|nr:radical SAM protein [Polyangiaceae bacterium]